MERSRRDKSTKSEARIWHSRRHPDLELFHFFVELALCIFDEPSIALVFPVLSVLFTIFLIALVVGIFCHLYRHNNTVSVSRKIVAKGHCRLRTAWAAKPTTSMSTLDRARAPSDDSTRVGQNLFWIDCLAAAEIRSQSSAPTHQDSRRD